MFVHLKNRSFNSLIIEAINDSVSLLAKNICIKAV